MTAAPMVARGRLRPVSVGGARLGRPTAWALVGLLVLVTLLAVFARPLAPYNPIQPVGPLNLAPLSPGHLLGFVLDSLFTDGLSIDLERLRQINSLLATPGSITAMCAPIGMNGLNATSHKCPSGSAK